MDKNFCKIKAMFLTITILMTTFCSSTNVLALGKGKGNFECEINITEEQAKLINLDYNDIIFSNFDNDLLNSYLNRPLIMPKSVMVGVPSESLETRTFTRSELQQLKKAQTIVRDYYKGTLNKSSFISLIKGANTMLAFKFPRASLLGTLIIKDLESSDKMGKQVMIKWSTDGLNLINKALSTGKSRVKIKYMRLTWKTTGFSIITGGAILK